MKTLRVILSLLAAVLLTATFAVAGEDDEPKIHTKHRVKLVTEVDSEPLVIEAEDLEVGETRQFFTDSGKEVVLTRTEEGLEVEVDGKKIDIGMHGGDHHSMFSFGGGEKKSVFIRKEKHGEHEEGEHGEHRYLYVHGDEDFEWVDGGEEDVEIIALHHQSALERLREAGVLDEVDEATRQKIIDALGGDDQQVKLRKKVIVVDVDEDEEEEN